MKKEKNNNEGVSFDNNDISENTYDIGDMNYNIIDNNIEQNIGIQQIIDESKADKVFIKKDLLRSINSFLACIGPPGAGKSTFCSNYYKILYKVKNNYFESSEGFVSFTKGIWVVSDAERRKIPVVIKRDLLDVEGFRVDEAKSWKYVMIIAFLSTDLLILNRNARFDDIKQVLKIIGNSLERMKKHKLPRILKKIYIQMTNLKKMKKVKIEEFLEQLDYKKSQFEGITFEYMYLPTIKSDYENVLDDPEYQKYFNNVLKLLNKTKLYNSVTSLINFIDDFNQTINGNTGFNSQTILKDIELDFNGVYSRYENKLKNELTKKINDLKPLEDLNETFEQFINKQEDLQLSFEIKNEELTFYGGCDDFNKFYENLKKKKSFKINPEDIFLDIYNTQKAALEILEKKRLQEEEDRRREEERKRQLEEERKRQEEEDKRREEERKRQLEEERKRQEEEDRRREEERKRQLEEERKKQEEEDRKMEEERKRQEEKRKRRQEEEDKKREEERQKQLEEERKKQEEEDKKREEERKRQLEEEKKKQEEEDRRREEERAKIEAERKQEEERLKKEYEEKKRRLNEEQKRKAEEEQRLREEERKRQLEEERKKQEEEDRRRREERKKQLEEEKKRQEEEDKRRRVERIRLERERIKKQQEEDARKKAERLRQLKEERKRQAEENARKEVERKRKEVERIRIQQEEDKKRREERKRQLEEERKKQEEEDRRIEQKRREEEAKRKKEEEELKIKREKERQALEDQQKILDEIQKKKAAVNHYFSTLKFFEEIDIEYISNFKLSIELKTNQTEFKKEKLKELAEHIMNKIKEKKEAWDAQIERAKWKNSVQAYGELKCTNGHELEDVVTCSKCKEQVFWVDGDEGYIICKGCEENSIRKITTLVCGLCGAESQSNIKWVRGYKP